MIPQYLVVEYIQIALNCLILFLPVMLIPLAIFIGWRWRNGVEIACAVGAIVAFLATRSGYLITGPIDSTSVVGYIYEYLFLFLPISGIMLMLGGWAIALDSALAERRWGAFAWLSAGIFADAVLVAFENPLSAANGMPVAPLLSNLILVVCCLLGPGNVLAYALWRSHAVERSAETQDTPPTTTPFDLQGGAQ